MPRESKTKLFHNKVIEKYIKSITISSKQREALNLWVDKLKKKELIEERSNYPIFQKYIVEDILGYSVEDFDFEKGNVEFTIKNQSGKPLLVLELKGQETDLFSKQSAGVTPYKQAFLYAVEKGTEYFATCNYSQIVFFLKENNYSKYEILDFQEMSKNENEFKKFILLFSKEYLVKRNIPALLKIDTVQEEKELTKEFYKIYHETRLMIIKELEVECKLSKEKAIHYSQIFLNRIMFICFAQDSEKHLLEPLILENTILKSIEKEMVGEHTYYIWESLINLFKSINLGDRIHNIPKYNGGLFSEDIPNDVKIRDFPVNQKYFNELNQGSKYSEKDINITILQRMGKYRTEINPIYKNLLLISSFDFKTDINVNILGHIFEQSIGDIEDLLSQNVSQRKKFGIFYTPEYITEYICRNTIIPYLSKTGNAKDIDELIYEYYNDLDELEDKVKKIKILDPACGSGAFLNKTVDVLLEIHRAIYETKLQKGKYKTTVEERHKRKKIEVEMESITLYFDDIEQQREIILNNIFGVDINEESVEITKLSLFLKIAARDIVLPNIDNNIKCGNSLIDDPAIAGDKAFKWEEKFPEVMKEGGFDIIIGNPPYVNIYTLAKNEKEVEYYQKNFETAHKKFDLYILFIELAIKRLKERGNFSFIVPDKWLYLPYGERLRSFILKTCCIAKIVDLTKFKIFKEASNTPIIFILRKNSEEQTRSQNKIHIIKPNTKSEDISNEKNCSIDIIPQKFFLETPHNMFRIQLTDDSLKIIRKIDARSIKVGDICYVNWGCRPVPLEKFYINKKFDEKHKPAIKGENIFKYYIKYDGMYLNYDPPQLYNPVFPELFERNSIVIRDIGGGKSIYATINDEHYYNTHTVINCLLKYEIVDIKNFNKKEIDESKNYNLKYLLGIINSKLILFYFRTLITDFLHTVPDSVRALPVKVAKSEEQQPLINLVDKMLSLHKRLNELGDKKTDERTRIEEEIKKTDREIDEFVYKLYGITEEEKRIIEERLK
jgi:hypothetical protein